MKKKLIYILVLSLCLGMTACNSQKKEETKPIAKEQKQEGQENSDKGDKISKKNKKADEDMVKFSQKYLDMYDQENNAYIILTFKNKDFIPKDLLSKVNIVEDELNKEKHLKGYKLIISCEDNVLYKISQFDYQKPQEHHIDSFYMSKGDFFLLEIKENEDMSKFIDAYKEPRLHSKTYMYIDITDDEELFQNGEILHNVELWSREMMPSPMLKELSTYIEKVPVYSKRASIDLDGDGIEERLYFWGEMNSYLLEETDAEKIQKNLSIDEYEIPLDKLSQENMDDSEEELYSNNFHTIEIIDINPKDKYKEILLEKSSYGLGNFLGKLYHFKNGEMQYIGKLNYSIEEEVLSGLTDDKLVITNVYGEEDLIYEHNYTFNKIYSIKDEKLIVEEPESVQINAFNSRIIPYLLKELNFYEKPDSKEPMGVLNPGDQLLFLESDKKTWIKVKSFDTGKIGYIKFRKSEEGYSLIMKDQEELKDLRWTDIFSRLPMWG